MSNFKLKKVRNINGIKHINTFEYHSLKDIANHYEITEIDIHNNQGRLLEKMENVLNDRESGVKYSISPTN